MSIANRVREELDTRSVSYALLQHPHTDTSQETAEATHVPGGRLAKAIVLQKEDGEFLLAVLPATHVAHYSAIEERYGSSVKPAEHDVLGRLFPDCEIGAVPPLGGLYGLPTVVEETAFGDDPVYFEAGDHESVVQLNAADFRALLSEADFFAFSAPSAHDP